MSSADRADVVASADAYLARHFQGKVLREELIHEWSPGARFWLGGLRGWPRRDRSRIQQVHERATALFEASFGPGDDGFLVAQFEAPVGLKVKAVDRALLRPGMRIPVEAGTLVRAPLLASLAELRPYVPATQLARSGTRIGLNLHGSLAELYPDQAAVEPDTEAGDDIPYLEAVLPVAPRGLEYRQLLIATANRETPYQPKVGCRLFFVNTTEHRILCVPDDRSLWVIGATSPALRPVVVRGAEWLEKADLPDDALFEDGRWK